MRKFLKRHKNSLGMKLGIFCASLALCLAVAELGLRLAGVAVTRSRDRVFAPPYDEKDYPGDHAFERYRGGKGPLILTFGDSLTNGGNVKSYESYPYHLFKRFAEAGGSAAVYNMGYCEDSTFGVASKLGAYFDSTGADKLPDAVVVLVGAADLFNLPLLRERKLKDDAFWYDMLPKGWIYSSRLYKVYRHIKISLSLKRGLEKPDDGGGGMSQNERFKALLEVYEAHKKTFGKGGPRQFLGPASVEKLTALFPGEIVEYRMNISSIEQFLELLIDQAGQIYFPRLRYDEFFGLLLDIARSFPVPFWSDRFDFPVPFWTNRFDDGHYYLLQTYRVQSKYTAADVLEVLDKTAREHPELARNEYFKNFRSIVADREEMDRYVDRKRMQAWGEIVRLCRERNIKLILQNYPVQYRSANRMLKTIAEKYGVPLIDNRARFAPLLKKEGREKYLEDDDHLTPIGYELLAEGVFAELEKAGLLSGR